MTRSISLSAPSLAWPSWLGSLLASFYGGRNAVSVANEWYIENPVIETVNHVTFLPFASVTVEKTPE
jgi:hypothetical protein